MNLMEWEVGIPGKQTVRSPFLIPHLTCLGQPIDTRMHSDALGGWRVQAYDGFPGRFVPPYPRYRRLQGTKFSYSRVQIIHPNHRSVRPLRL